MQGFRISKWGKEIIDTYNVPELERLADGYRKALNSHVKDPIPQMVPIWTAGLEYVEGLIKQKTIPTPAPPATPAPAIKQLTIF